MAGSVGYDYAGFFCDELGTQVVRMAAVAERSAAGSNERLNEWAQIGHETILADRQVVNLSTSAGVLVFENGHLARITRDDTLAELFIDGGQNITATRKESAN